MRVNNDIARKVNALRGAAGSGFVGIRQLGSGVDGAVLFTGDATTAAMELVVDGANWDGSNVDWNVLEGRAVPGTVLQRMIRAAQRHEDRGGATAPSIRTEELGHGAVSIWVGDDCEIATAECTIAGINWTPKATTSGMTDFAEVDLHHFADALKGAQRFVRGRPITGGGVFVSQGSTDAFVRLSATDSYGFRIQEVVSSVTVPNEPFVINPTIAGMIRQLKSLFPKGSKAKLKIGRNPSGEIGTFAAAVDGVIVHGATVNVDLSTGSHPVLWAADAVASLDPNPDWSLTFDRTSWADELAAAETVGDTALLSFDGVTGTLVPVPTGDKLAVRGVGKFRATLPVVGTPGQIAVPLERLATGLVTVSSVPGAENLKASSDDDGDEVDKSELTTVSIARLAGRNGGFMSGILVSRPGDDSVKTFVVRTNAITPNTEIPFGIALDNLVV